MDSRTIDIIIPIYNAYEYLLSCLESIRRNTVGAYRLILIDDASTDSRINSLFKELGEKKNKNILLIKNEHNQGFVATANRGMSIGKNDIVLLNSDTLVTKNWLSKLKRCADSDPRIGTITPFSNNAEICSFPDFCRENPVPKDIEIVNLAMEEASLPFYVDIPTGVGFCLYIRRALIDRIGLFDVETFGKGYGEENDFCLRATRSSYRNVLCSDVYVAHVGSCSFGQEKRELAEKQMAVLLRKHPTYAEQVGRFIARDPLKPIRQMIQTRLRILSSPNNPGILHVLHGHGGGTEKSIRNLAALMQDKFRHYLLITLEREWIVKAIDLGGEDKSYHFHHQNNELWVEFLESICAWLDIHLCHVHQLSGCRDGLLAAFSKTTIPYGFSIHDFFLACPSINFLDSEGSYCGAVTDRVQCQQCLDQQINFSEVDIQKWRLKHKEFLSKSAFISAPSLWAKNTFSKYFPESVVEIISNVHHSGFSKSLEGGLRCFLFPKDEIKHIGVIGAIGPVKGARNLEQLVAKTRERKLPLRWIIIGYTDRQYEPYQSKDYVLTIHGPYQQDRLIALLEHYTISLVVFPSAGPETFCYTLSEAWAANKPVLVPPIGALKERVEHKGAGWIMEDWKDMDKVLDQIMNLTSSESREISLAKIKEAGHAYHSNECCEIENLYQRFLASESISSLKSIPPLRVYESACYGLDVDGIKNKRLLLSQMIGKIVRYGIRFRYTAFGRWAERKLPASWHYRLRRFLLQG